MYICVRVCLCICVDVKAYVCVFLAVPRRCEHVSYMYLLCECLLACVWMYTYMCMWSNYVRSVSHICICVCYTYVSAFIYRYLYIHRCVYIHTCMCVHTRVYIHTCMCVHTYIHVCIYLALPPRWEGVIYIYILCVCHTATHIQQNADRMAKNLEIIPNTLQANRNCSKHLWLVPGNTMILMIHPMRILLWLVLKWS